MLLLALAAPARAAGCGSPPCPAPDRTHADRAVQFMAELRDESVRHAHRVRAAYAPQVRRLALPDRPALQRALETARLVPLPRHPAFNLNLRLDGAHPIGELDLPHQPLYVAARPETLGCLLHVASRVESGALEVTSLVRHSAYQRSLARRNPNARTAVPTHVMGLAFDISILNVPLSRAAEIRDVLRYMAAEGDLFFIAEQRQLVFHVVPAPARRAYYVALHAAMTTVERPAILLPGWPLAPPAAALEALLPPDLEVVPAAPGPRLRQAGWTALLGLVLVGLSRRGRLRAPRPGRPVMGNPGR